MSWFPLGDSAWLFSPVGEDAAERRGQMMRMARSLQDHPPAGMTDLVVSFDTLAVQFDPSDGPSILRELHDHPVSGQDPSTDQDPSTRVHDIPVLYGGEDLESVARSLNRTQEEVVSLHSSVTYEVAAIGFSPGFPYLLGLPGELHVPRKGKPAPVPAGAVAIAAGQAGIYPFASPGGWWVLGETRVSLFDPERNPPALLQAGDFIRFAPASSLPPPSPPAISTPQADGHFCEVVETGGICTIQDSGRSGYQQAGVSPGGAADPEAAMAAKIILDNPPDSAVLECAMKGPVVRFSRDVWAAWTGWSDGGEPRYIPAGEVLDLTRPTRLLRGYLAISGGFTPPIRLGSRSTDLRGRFGGHDGRLLATGDLLAIGAPCHTQPTARIRVGWPHAISRNQTLVLRVLPGVQAHGFSPETVDRFHSSVFLIRPESDRMGIRLSGPSLHHPIAEMRSQPVVAGSIQVPPDGVPIILMNDRQTIGGYPQIAHVIRADLSKLARAWPGTPIRFEAVTLGEARFAWMRRNRHLALLRTGVMFKQSSA